MMLPEPYETRQSLRVLRKLSPDTLRMNLAFHMQKDSRITLEGGVNELSLKLHKILSRRCVTAPSKSARQLRQKTLIDVSR